MIDNAQTIVADGGIGVRPCFSLPPGMVPLREVLVKRCQLLEGWLPQCSRGHVRSLHITSSHLKCLHDMCGLEDLALHSCWGIGGGDWLPESTRGSVRTLEVCDCSVCSVPPEMHALEQLYLSNCPRPTANWFPDSSRQRVRVLSVDDWYGISAVPGEMPALEAVRLSSNQLLSANWLPASLAQQLRVLFIDNSHASYIPRGLGSLEILSVEHSRWSATEWLPASSSKCITTIHAAGCSSLVRLPTRMGALLVINFRGCNRLATRWLPASSAACERELRAHNRLTQELPQHLRWLESVRVLQGSHMPTDRTLRMARSRCVFLLVCLLLSNSPMMAVLIDLAVH